MVAQAAGDGASPSAAEKDRDNSVRLTIDNHSISRFEQRFHKTEKSIIGISMDLVAPVKTVHMITGKSGNFAKVDHPSLPLYQCSRAATRIIVWFDASTAKARAKAQGFVDSMLARDSEHLGDLAQAEDGSAAMQLGEFSDPIPERHEPVKHNKIIRKLGKTCIGQIFQL